MKWLAHAITLVLLIAYYILFSAVLLIVPPDASLWLMIPVTIGFALFMIISMGALFETFPESLQKYFRNKSLENPDGCGF